MKKIIIILLLLISSMALFSLVFLGPSSSEKAAKSLPEPQKYNLDELNQKILTDCPDNLLTCFEEKLKEINTLNGPEASLAVLQELKDTNFISPSVDDHQIAHRLGRETAKTFGSNGKSFLLCPTTFNYGCGHGFFEYVLGRTDSTKEAAQLICGGIEADSSFSPKFKFYCYHGLGHGILMAQAYDLVRSLDICDSLPTMVGQGGCWQGVFMENVNAGMRGEAREGIFSDKDPLAPCNRVAEKHRHECFINHSGWLVGFYGNDLSRASLACLKAPENFINACIQSLGLMTSNPAWQPNLAAKEDLGSTEQTTWNLCKKFPAGYIGECVISALDNIMNFHELDSMAGSAFCDIVGNNYKERCFVRIGTNLKNQTVSAEVIQNKCADLGSRKELCLSGAKN